VHSSGHYRLNPTENFQRSLKTIFKDHYKKIPKARALLEEQLDQLFEQLETAPHKVPFSWKEPWPKNTHKPGFEFYKLDFKMPRLSHAAAEGRVMWLVCDQARTVDIIWIYTHDEFRTRPSDRDLRSLLEAAVKQAVRAILEAGSPPKVPELPLYDGEQLAPEGG
jgi:hypothetical protein